MRLGNKNKRKSYQADAFVSRISPHNMPEPFKRSYKRRKMSLEIARLAQRGG